MLYTAKQISDIVGKELDERIPPTTLAFWINETFKEYIPPTKNDKYTDDTIDIVRIIAKQKGYGSTNKVRDNNEEIKALLEKNYGVYQEGEEGDSKQLVTTPTQNAIIEHNKRMEDLMVGTQQQLASVVSEMQRSNSIMQQLISYLVKKEVDNNEDETKVAQEPTPEKTKTVKKTTKKPVKKTAPKPKYKTGDWTKSDENQLRKLSGSPIDTFVKQLNRTPQSIRAKINALNKSRGLFTREIKYT